MNSRILKFFMAGWAMQSLLAAPPPPDFDEGASPVTIARLTGARLEHHRNDPSLVWTFTDSSFVLELGGQTPAWNLIETLMGTTNVVARIEGNWKLDEKAGQLVLSNIKGDGKAGRKSATLPIAPAGHVRVNLGTYQYNLFRSARSKPGP